MNKIPEIGCFVNVLNAAADAWRVEVNCGATATPDSIFWNNIGPGAWCLVDCPWAKCGPTMFPWPQQHTRYMQLLSILYSPSNDGWMRNTMYTYTREMHRTYKKWASALGTTRVGGRGDAAYYLDAKSSSNWHRWQSKELRPLPSPTPPPNTCYSSSDKHNSRLYSRCQPTAMGKVEVALAIRSLRQYIENMEHNNQELLIWRSPFSIQFFFSSSHSA